MKHVKAYLVYARVDKSLGEDPLFFPFMFVFVQVFRETTCFQPSAFK